MRQRRACTIRGARPDSRGVLPIPAIRMTEGPMKSSKRERRWGTNGSPGAGFENPSLCSVCQGECCRAIPGETCPSDWTGRRQILGALVSGRYAIDCWEDDPALGSIYYVRPAVRKIGPVNDLTFQVQFRRRSLFPTPPSPG